MNIKPVIYENLTIHERIIATLEANIREDEDERIRLVKTCPKKSYRMTDPAYTSMMEALYDMALVVESDMRGCVLSFFMQMWLVDNLPDQSGLDAEHKFNLAPCKLQEMISIQQAWHEFLYDQGIPRETADKAFGEIKHLGLEWALEIAERMKLQSDEDTVCQYKALMDDYVKKISN